MTIEVLMYHSAQAGAPSATLVAAGSLTTLLDACLVNGFNTRTVTSLTRTGSVATANISGTNPFQIGDVIEVEGASPAAYSARHRVTARNDGSVSFAIDGTPASPATGTITIKHPGAGWQRLAIATNVVGYRTVAGGSEHWLQVEDNNPFADSGGSARVRMAVGLTGLDTASQLSEQTRIQKLNGWVLVADGRTAYLFFQQNLSFAFGDFAPFGSADDFAFMCSRGSNASSSVTVEGGNNTTAGTSFPALGTDSNYAAGNLGGRILRGYTQVGADVNAYPGFVRATNDQTVNNFPTISGSRGGSLVSPVDGKVLLFPILLMERGATSGFAGSFFRGQFRGVYQLGGAVPAESFVNGFTLLDEIVINGVTRRVAVVRWGTLQSVFQMAVDISDTWD
jgi:hypothetical protein